MRSTQDTAGLTAKTNAITDTSLSGNLTFLGWQGIQPYMSLGLNMPTGKTIHSGGSVYAKGDPDVVALPTFGEGWNVAPTIGANIPLNESTILAFGFGYTYRGPFSRDKCSTACDQPL